MHANKVYPPTLANNWMERQSGQGKGILIAAITINILTQVVSTSSSSAAPLRVLYSKDYSLTYIRCTVLIIKTPKSNKNFAASAGRTFPFQNGCHTFPLLHNSNCTQLISHINWLNRIKRFLYWQHPKRSSLNRYHINIIYTTCDQFNEPVINFHIVVDLILQSFGEW